MDERDWLIFSILYDKRNITKTGQALFISQPALTARLRQIEDSFGAKLIYRSGKGIHFTPQGEYLAKCAKEMVEHSQRIRNQIANMNEGVQGTLRIAASRYLSKYKLPHLLKAFKNLYPAVEFKLTTLPSKEVLSLVNNQDCHVGFLRKETAWPGEKRLLFVEPLCIISTNPITLADLPAMPRISFHSDTLSQLLADNWWREHFTTPPKISMEVDSFDTCKEMVISGLGYAIMTNSAFRGVDDIYQLPLIDKENNPIVRKNLMIYQQESLRINAVKAFIEFTEQTDFPAL